MVHGLALHQPLEDAEILVRHGIALVVIKPHAIGADGLGVAGDDVDQQPAAGEFLERRGHLGQQGGGDQPRVHGAQELHPLGVRHQCGRQHPNVVRARGEQRAGVAKAVIGFGKLLEIGKVEWAGAFRVPRIGAIRGAHVP